MIKIESSSLELAYSQAANELSCSVTQLHVEIVQHPSKGFLGFFAKPAIIVAECKVLTVEETTVTTTQKVSVTQDEVEVAEEVVVEERVSVVPGHSLNETILPKSFVTDQDEEDEQNAYINDVVEGMFDDDEEEGYNDIDEIVDEVREQVNALFAHICFDIENIEVAVYDDNTLKIIFNGEDAALLIGKEGYRYKALSYMLFNWLNAKYTVQLRLEIAEFLQNQEESITRYLVGVCENIKRDGKAQTKVLDGVLVQIALKQLRDQYPDKYVAIRSTRDGAKFIIVNGYNEY